METERNPARWLARPWATLLLAVLAGLIFWSPTNRWLIFDRGQILQGQFWRAWTGHLVHFTPSHLFWNLAVFIPAGCWLERVWPRQARWFYAIAPFAISGVLLVFDPGLARYAGLSGVAAGLLVLLAGLQLLRRDRPDPAWIWIGVMMLVAAKVGYELLVGTPLLVSGFEDIRNAPLAHVGGVVCGAAFLGVHLTKPMRSTG